MKDKEFEKIKKIFSKWQVRVPPYILKLTSEEVYMMGFQSGYECKLSELQEQIQRTIFEFKVIKKDD